MISNSYITSLQEAESERLEKIQTIAKLPLIVSRADTDTALAKYENHKKLTSQVQQKVDNATENRANRLKELREKLKAKEAHAAQVRQRKLSISMAETNTDIANDALPQSSMQS